jgi:hypothetical protein
MVNATPRPLYPRERPGTLCIDYVGPRDLLNGWRISRLHRDPIPGPSSPQRVAIKTEISRSTIIIIIIIIIIIVGKLLGQILTSYKLNSAIPEKILLPLLLLLLLSSSSSSSLHGILKESFPEASVKNCP